MTSADDIAAVLRDHQYGFMGHCVNERGLPDDCGWRSSRRRKDESLSEQHRQHLAEQIAAVVTPSAGGEGQ